VLQKKIILYADDDADDRTWMADACKSLGIPLQINFVENGREVLAYLSNQSSPLPQLIVLDLNMPELDGRQTLKQLKSTPKLANIPVAIVTTSGNSMDKDACNRLGAAAYLTKPNTHSEWQNILKQLQLFIH